MKFYEISVIAFAILLITTVKSDISDDECGIWEEEETTTTVSSITDKPVNVSSTPKTEKPEKYRIINPKKSLLIVFDGTGSMSDDLVQMRDAAKEIITSFSTRKDKPIKNYVLTVFKDPVQYFLPTVNTNDPKELFAKLDAIVVGGDPNPDIPEPSITGLKFALEHAMRFSIAYVFTDATSNDHLLHTEILPIILKKQVRVNFVLSDDVVVNSADPGYNVFEKLALASEGQVFLMKTNIIKDVLLAITQVLDPKYATLNSFNFDKAGSTTKAISVDQGFSALSVSLSGKNSKLIVKDKNNGEVKTRSGFTSDNIKFMTFDVVDASYTIMASADSAYSIRVGGISDLKFEFGFSTNLPSEQAETSTQPLNGFKNVLSIFVSDHDLVKCLIQATLIPANPVDSFSDIIVPFERTKRSIYCSRPFEVPSKMFKIKINGYDKKGSVIERLISSGIESVNGFPPEVDIEDSTLEVNQYGNLHLNCKVNSLTPATTTWMFESNVLSTRSSNQSTQNILTVEKFDEKNVGKYLCKAQNSLGEASKEVSISIKLAPIVKVVPDKLKLTNGETGSLECIVKGNYGDFKILWKDEFEVLGVKNLPTYKFTATRHHHNQFITCEVQNGDFLVSNNSTITVEYPPEFYEGTNGASFKKKFQYGSNLELNCSSHEYLEGTVKWFYSVNGKKITKQIIGDMKILSLKNMTTSMKGVYKCVIENSVGNSSKTFTVTHSPNEPPTIKYDREKTVKLGDDVKLECSCSECLPTKPPKWIKKFKNNKKDKVLHTVENFEDEINNTFTTVLTIKNTKSADEGTYTCQISNELGKDTKKIELTAQTKPNDIKVTVKGKSSKAVAVDKFVEIKKKERLELVCIAKAHPIPKMLWFKDGKEISSGKEFVLEKENINQHAGNYMCTVTNDLGSISKDFNIRVKIAPTPNVKNEQLIVAEENEKIRLNCDIYGSPEPNFTWSFNYKPLNISKNHKFTNQNKVLELSIQHYSVGTYSCFGQNDFGKASIKFAVFVKSAPSFLNSNDEFIKKKVDEQLKLSCYANGYPRPLIHWTKESSEEEIQNGESFSISSSGVYWCHARNDVGEAKKKFEVSVVDLPSFLFSLKDIAIFTNESKEAKAVAFGYPEPKVYWTFNDVKIKDGESLTFDSSMKSGVYSYFAENSEGKAENSLNFKIAAEPTLLKDFDESSVLKSVREGDDLELLCPLENFDEVSWERNDVLLNQRDQKLKISKISKFLTGEYKCTASNSIGSKSFLYEVDLLTAPTIAALDPKTSSVVFTSLDVQENMMKTGQTLELTCEVQGNPKPSIKWTKSGIEKTQEKSFRIENLTSEDAGTYTCTAENTQGVAKKLVKVKVSSAPFIEDGIKEVIENRSVGDDLTLDCKINGSPKPNFFWTKDHSHIEGKSTKILELGKVSADQSGNYQCIGSNAFGQEKIQFTVSVNDPAVVISAAEIEEENSIGDESLTISCVVKGNPLPKISWLNEKFVLSSTAQLALEGLFKKSSVIYLDSRGKLLRYPNFRSRESFHAQLSKEGESLLQFDITFKDKRSVNLANLRCEAENVHGKDEKTITQKEPVEDKNLRFVDGKGEEVQLDIQFGHELDLNCAFEGPMGEIQWIFNGKEVTSENEDFILTHNKQVLKINNVDESHKNDFFCLVSNSFGSLKRYFRITVLTKAQWSKFTPWTECSETCGKGFQVRTRICLMSNGEKPLNGVKCEGDEYESQTCIISECFDDGWTEWSNFTPCSKTCGTGYQVKRRQCQILKELREVGKCEGSAEEYKYCKNPAC